MIFGKGILDQKKIKLEKIRWHQQTKETRNDFLEKQTAFGDLYATAQKSKSFWQDSQKTMPVYKIPLLKYSWTSLNRHIWKVYHCKKLWKRGEWP